MQRAMWNWGSAVAVVCIFCGFTFLRSGAIGAAIQTTVLTLSLFVILKVAGRGKWTTAFRSLVAHPGRCVFIFILLGVFIARRWDGLTWPVALDVLLVGGFFWAFDTLASSFFQRHFFAKSRNEGKSVK